jgi:ubiquinone/menaquinone biosynthesis C-methylase UbiE
VDWFEHFGQPDEVLKEMARMLKPDGKVIVSFGPPWYHPKGGPFIFMGSPAANREVVDEIAFEVQTEEISRGCRRLEPNEHPQI